MVVNNVITISTPDIPEMKVITGNDIYSSPFLTSIKVSLALSKYKQVVCWALTTNNDKYYEIK